MNEISNSQYNFELEFNPYNFYSATNKSDLPQKFQCEVSLTDEYANKNEVKDYFSHDLLKIEEIKNQDVVVVSVAHDHYKNLKEKDWKKMLKRNVTGI